MPQLPSINDCCGCGACVDTCPKEAISLDEDKNGFYNFTINKGRCIECKLCENRCHILQQTKLKRSKPSKVQPFAAWSKTEELIKHSATGGIFAQVAYNMLIEDNTFVYGAALQNDNSVRHIEIADVNDLTKLQNSKYQQSYCSGIYKQVKDRLTNGYRVLFSGLPCQIAALYIFLNYKEKYIGNLYTIEVLCHGVPTNDLHRTALKNNGMANIVSYRTKGTWGWIGNNRLTYKSFNGEIETCFSYNKDCLFRSYLTFNSVRKNCYSCKYSCIQRVSDLTIGDFWGWDKSINSKQYINKWGTSIVIPNNEKGKEMISEDNIHKVKTSWDEILPQNQNLYMPTNVFNFSISNWIYLFKWMPVSIKKIIYQEGFTSMFMYRVSLHLRRLLFKKRREQQQLVKQQQLHKLLKEIKYEK